MNQLVFKPSPTTTLDRDTIQLRRAVGGSVGTLSAGDNKKTTVLKLQDNLYVTTDKRAARLKVLANMDKADIHIVDTQADLAYFVARYTLHKRRA